MVKKSDKPATGELYPSYADIYVGKRLEAKMKEKKLSYADLGISKQQLEDYIQGYRRIGSARLFEFSMELDTTVAYFFEGLEMPDEPGIELDGHISPQRLLTHFYRAKVGTRKKVMKLLKIKTQGSKES